MPRLFAQNRTSMWQDDDFRALSDGAQNLYNYLLAHPTTTYAGVADWFPKRLAHVNTSWTQERVEELGQELAAGHFVVIDEDWDEVCVRSFLRWESVLKVPNLARAAAHAFKKIESPRLQRVVIHELLRLRDEEPGWAAWNLEEFGAILTSRPPLDGKTIDSPIGSRNPSANPSRNPPTDPDPKGSGKGPANPSAKGSPITSNKYPLTSNPEPVPANPPNSDDEFTARAHLKALDLDYTELRKILTRACERQPSPDQVVEIAVAIMRESQTTPEHPMAYVVAAVKESWAKWQQMIDEAVA